MFRDLAPRFGPTDPFFPRFWKNKLNDKILKSRKWRGIFLVDMGELFGPWLPPDWTRRVLDITKNYPLNRYYVLTKQYEELTRHSPFNDNTWVGCSATNLDTTVLAAKALQRIEAHIKFLSLEPLQARMNISAATLSAYGIGWIIIGAQSKPTINPEVDWVREVVESAVAARIPVFLKNSLDDVLPVESIFRDPGSYELRQEMPETGGRFKK